MLYSPPMIVDVRPADEEIQGGKDGLNFETVSERSIAPAYPADE